MQYITFIVKMGVIRQLYSSDTTDYLDLEQLFKDYYDRLVFFSMQIVKNDQQAEDTVQDAFIGYWQQRHQIADHPNAIKNYLYRSVKNASLDFVRHLKYVDQYVELHQSKEPREAYILEAIVSAEAMAELYNALNSLPDHLRVVSRLSFLEGKKNQEVADELQISVNTVKKQKQRALILLKDKLRPDIFAILIGFDYLIHK